MEWKKFSEEKPTENGWYLVTVDHSTDKKCFRVMSLYWNGEAFKDNLRLHVFYCYHVMSIDPHYGMQRIHGDRSCDRTEEVIAWAELPEPYKED